MPSLVQAFKTLPFVVSKVAKSSTLYVLAWVYASLDPQPRAATSLSVRSNILLQPRFRPRLFRLLRYSLVWPIISIYVNESSNISVRIHNPYKTRNLPPYQSKVTSCIDDLFSHVFIQVVDCSSPLAWKPGSPFGIVAEVTLQNLALMTAAFMENRLILDDMLELSQMLSE